MKKSIKRLPKCTQEELTVLLDLVCKSIGNCQMVILFGSYARGNYVLWDTNIEFGVHTSYQSDYDILLVVTGQTKYVERKLNRITNQYHDLFAGRRHAFPQFVVEHINTVNRNLEISQYFFIPPSQRINSNSDSKYAYCNLIARLLGKINDGVNLKIFELNLPESYRLYLGLIEQIVEVLNDETDNCFHLEGDDKQKVEMALFMKFNEYEEKVKAWRLTGN